MIVLVHLLRGCAVLLRLLAAPLILIGWVAASVAEPLIWTSRRCHDRAREWDPRLWERGQHTDLHPPPGA